MHVQGDAENASVAVLFNGNGYTIFIDNGSAEELR